MGGGPEQTERQIGSLCGGPEKVGSTGTAVGRAGRAGSGTEWGGDSATGIISVGGGTSTTGIISVVGGTSTTCIISVGCAGWFDRRAGDASTTGIISVVGGTTTGITSVGGDTSRGGWLDRHTGWFDHRAVRTAETTSDSEWCDHSRSMVPDMLGYCYSPEKGPRCCVGLLIMGHSRTAKRDGVEHAGDSTSKHDTGPAE